MKNISSLAMIVVFLGAMVACGFVGSPENVSKGQQATQFPSPQAGQTKEAPSPQQGIATKCNQPDPLSAMQQALAKVTSVRGTLKVVSGQSEQTITIEEVVSGNGTNIHYVQVVRNPNGETRTQDIILMGNDSWEKGPDGKWKGSSRSRDGYTIIYQFGSSQMHIGSKTGSTVYANQPTDIYEVSVPGQSGTLYLSTQTCLPLRMVTPSGQASSGNYDQMMEWNIPLTITRPSP